MIIDGHWMPTHRADPRLTDLYLRHYTAAKNRPWLALQSGWERALLRHLSPTNVVANGTPMCLLTTDCRAGWVWLRCKSRDDGQDGICCTLFRNEGGVSSEVLIREAETLAWHKWPGERLFTYVDPTEIASEVAGWCFIRARWRQRSDMTSASGKLLFEKLAGPSCRWPRRTARQRQLGAIAA